jgi:hypothetical protein
MGNTRGLCDSTLFSVDDFQAGDEQKVDDFKVLATGENNDRPATSRGREKLRMLNVERSTICQVDSERTKRLGVESVSNLFNRHEFTLDDNNGTKKGGSRPPCHSQKCLPTT